MADPQNQTGSAVKERPDVQKKEPALYKVVLLNDSSTPEVGFYRDGKLIGQAPVKLVDQGKKFQETEVDANILDDHSAVITEMHLTGWTEKLIFSGSDTGSASGQ